QRISPVNRISADLAAGNPKERAMKIALTGATGFLGRYNVSHLAGAGHRLRCWHREGSDRSGFDAVAGAVEWLPGELGDAAAIRQLVDGVDAVVHGAVE